MADEVTDISNVEQVVIYLHHVDVNFEPHEDFVGLHAVDPIKSDVLLVFSEVSVMTGQSICVDRKMVRQLSMIA